MARRFSSLAAPLTGVPSCHGLTPPRTFSTGIVDELRERVGVCPLSTSSGASTGCGGSGCSVEPPARIGGGGGGSSAYVKSYAAARGCCSFSAPRADRVPPGELGFDQTVGEVLPPPPLRQEDDADGPLPARLAAGWRIGGLASRVLASRVLASRVLASRVLAPEAADHPRGPACSSPPSVASASPTAAPPLKAAATGALSSATEPAAQLPAPSAAATVGPSAAGVGSSFALIAASASAPAGPGSQIAAGCGASSTGASNGSIGGATEPSTRSSANDGDCGGP